MEPSVCCDISHPVQSPCGSTVATPLGRTESVPYRTAVVLQCAFVSLYIGVLVWFGWVDVYHKHYFHPSSLYLGYHLARVLFIAYLCWFQFYLGLQLLQFWQRRRANLKLSLLDEFILCYYAGGAILAGCTFVLGFLNLYYYWLFACGSLVLLAVSSAKFVHTSRVWWKAALAAATDNRSLIRLVSYWICLTCVLVVAATLLLVKGIYPGGGGDYYTHYFPYFQHVLSSHGLWPNDVWYHFYVSKGATVTIFSMLLTDPLAPEIVTYLYFFVGTLCVYSLLRRCVNNRIFPCLGMTVSLGALLWTHNKLYGDWGQFQKHHEFTASLLISVVWILTTCANRTGTTLKAWLTFICLMVGHCILHVADRLPARVCFTGSRYRRGLSETSLGSVRRFGVWHGLRRLLFLRTPDPQLLLHRPGRGYPHAGVLEVCRPGAF